MSVKSRLTIEGNVSVYKQTNNAEYKSYTYEQTKFPNKEQIHFKFDSREQPEGSQLVLIKVNNDFVSFHELIDCLNEIKYKL